LLLQSCPRNCGSISAPIASSLQRRQPVVTTRTMPQPSSSYGGWRKLRPQVTGSLTRRHPRPRNAARPYARSPRAQCNAAPKRRPSEPWVNGSLRWTDFQQESTIDAKNGCSRGKQQKSLHKSGVVSRVPCRSRSAEQARRTQTLTGQASHTSSSVKGSTKGATKGERD
jgi:hypothetical protein